MPRHIEKTTKIAAAGNLAKIIEEFVGSVNTNDQAVSIAMMKSPKGWAEPGQTPEFKECSIVLEGCLKVETRQNSYNVVAGHAFIAEPGEWVRYSTPGEGGAEYLAVCVPAFSPGAVHRDEE